MKGHQKTWITSREKNLNYSFLLSSLFSPFPRNVRIEGKWCQKILHLGAWGQHRETPPQPRKQNTNRNTCYGDLWWLGVLLLQQSLPCPGWCITAQDCEGWVGNIRRACHWALLLVTPGQCQLHSFRIQASAEWLCKLPSDLHIPQCVCKCEHAHTSKHKKYVMFVNSY